MLCSVLLLTWPEGYCSIVLQCKWPECMLCFQCTAMYMTPVGVVFKCTAVQMTTMGVVLLVYYSLHDPNGCCGLVYSIVHEPNGCCVLVYCIVHDPNGCCGFSVLQCTWPQWVLLLVIYTVFYDLMMYIMYRSYICIYHVEHNRWNMKYIGPTICDILSVM